MIFEYPEPPLERTHGPAGYLTHESFRPWLRDEFTFRCVYCLKREMWGQVTGEFELDHFEPKSLAPERTLDYFNLVYACRRCNSAKLDQPIDDPLTILSSNVVVVLPDGLLSSDSLDAKRLIEQIDLNSPALRRWRVMWMPIVDLANKRDVVLYQQLTGFPEDLPDLGRLRPPSNSRPEGIEFSWHAKQQRGQLPRSY
ncbi:MAG: HNH endonuclease signature motif containing protein [Pirellulaceae bacterium]|nr:HNH endonuclease [Planctomycetales bacterium]